MGYYNELCGVLSTAKKESDISSYLKNNLQLIRRLKSYWNGDVIKAEFAIGAKYIADFVVLSACSGCWECLLIEMQSPCDRIFTKNGEYTAQLKEAQRQLQDWQMYIHQNEHAFRDQLAELAHDLPAFCSRADLHQTAYTELRDPRTYIEFNYMVLIGRKAFLSQDDNYRRSLPANGFKIVTFDRLLEFAKDLDKCKVQYSEVNS